MRVYEAAKDIGVKSGEVVNVLVKNGFDVKHSNTLTPEMKEVLQRHYGVGEIKAEKEKKKEKIDAPVIIEVIKKRKEVKKEEDKEGKKEELKEKKEVKKEKSGKKTKKIKKKDKESSAKEVPPDKKAEKKGQEELEDKAGDKKVPGKDKPRVQQMVFKKQVEQALLQEYKKDKSEVGMGRKEKDKKRFDIQSITKQIESLGKKKRRKKSKLQRLIKKKRIAEKLEKERKEQEWQDNVIRITDPTTVMDLSIKLNKTPAELVKKLKENGVESTTTQEIDAEIASMIAEEYGHQVEIFKLYQDIDKEEKPEDKIEENLVERAPVVTVMGHVDHGKTTLLDAIRSTDVAGRESGGITQHIGAYKIKYKGKEIVFIDTPGHKAFTEMRARGAKVTDLVVLVIAAEDGVMPQTMEAINHSRAFNVPIIVAINKIDKPNADINKLKQQLSENGILLEDWGGDVLSVEMSALKKIGIDKLLESILLQSEMLELKCNSELKAEGIVLESKIDKGLGPKLTVLVRNGVLKKGDPFVAGIFNGKARTLIDDTGHRIKSVTAAAPVEIIGCTGLPKAGDPFNVVKDESTAKELSESRSQLVRDSDLKESKKVSLEKVFQSFNESDYKELKIILKTDVNGSLEAIRNSIENLNTEKIGIKVIHFGVGGITENDVLLAAAAEAIVIGFNVRAGGKTASLAANKEVEIRFYKVIYELIDDIKKFMTGMLGSRIEEEIIGETEVQEIFKISKLGKIAGSRVTKGKVQINSKARLYRNDIVIYTGKIVSLRHFKEDVKEVVNGQECGIRLENYEDIKPGDMIEVYIEKEVKEKLDG